MAKNVEKYTPLGRMIDEEVAKINEENEYKTAYTLTQLAENMGSDISLLSKFLTGKRRMPLTRLMEAIIIMRCDPETATKLIHEAGYDISGNTVAYCKEYRTIIEHLRDPAWIDSDAAKEVFTIACLGNLKGFVR